MGRFLMSMSRGFSILPPQTVNVGASFGPRISTAGFEISTWRRLPSIRLRLYADLDGKLWQDDGDINRRGAHAVVPFSKRAAKALREGRGQVETGAMERRPGIYGTAIFFSDEVEGFERRLQCNIEFRASEGDDLAAAEARWLAHTIDMTTRMGTDIYVAVHDPANSNVFQVSRKAG